MVVLRDEELFNLYFIVNYNFDSYNRQLGKYK